MRRLVLSVCVTAAILSSSPGGAYGQDLVGTAFVYQGQLNDEGVPANDEYDFIFRLFDDPIAGLQVGGDVEIDEWLVSDGLFAVELDFGPGVFTGDALWLGVSVRLSDDGGYYTDLSPRQPVNATPFALYALSGPGSGGYWTLSDGHIYNNNPGHVGIGTMTPASVLDVQSTEGTHGLMSTVPWIPVWAHRTSTSGTWPAIHGECDSEDDDGSAVRGFMTSASSGTHSAAVRGVNSGYGYGVHGRSTGTGVYGETDSDWAAGVRGTSNATGFGFGVYGNHAGAGWGVVGISAEDTGVHGITHADWYGAGVHGHNSGTFGYGVYGTTDGGGIGVYGDVPGGIGVFGESTGGGAGVHGTTDSVEAYAIGVEGVINTTGPGGYSAGVRGRNNGTGGNGIGVYGSQDGSGWGVYGYTPSGRGVYGRSTGGVGVYGHNDATTWDGSGVRGTHAGYGSGVYGQSSGGIGVHAVSTSGWALYAETDGDVAARFVGNVEIASSSSGQILIEFGDGLDYAEGFDVCDDREITPGAVLVIDVDNAGKLAMSTTPYDRKVAGIVAGANGLGSAVRLGAGQYDFDVALAGRVYCNVDASDGVIQPGDLLTTSPTPGYAMKVTDHARAQGAILGKAMQSLEQGEQGQILVLVTLQ